jgi:hypothetical protein
MIQGRDFEVQPYSGDPDDPNAWLVKILIPRWKNVRIRYFNIEPTDKGSVKFVVKIMSYPSGVIDRFNWVDLEGDLYTDDFLEVCSRILTTILDQLLKIRDNTA